MGDFIIGLDGGWSKTAGVLCDHDGRVLAEAHAGRSAVAGIPSPETLGLLDNLIDTLCRQAKVSRRDIIHTCLGLNGVDYADEVAWQHQKLCEALDLAPSQLTLVNDGVAALWGVSANPRLSLVQHGSGLTAAYRTAPGRETIFDSLDAGGIFDVRREALRATARMLDGRLDYSLLADRVIAHCQTTSARFAEDVYRGDKVRDQFFTLAPVVFQAWRDGDPVADDMAARAADDYVLAVSAMARRLGPGAFDAGFSGGVIQAGGTRLMDRIGERLAAKCPEARLVTVCLPPERGAVVMAAHVMGLPPIFQALRAPFP